MPPNAPGHPGCRRESHAPQAIPEVSPSGAAVASQPALPITKSCGRTSLNGSDSRIAGSVTFHDNGSVFNVRI